MSILIVGSIIFLLPKSYVAVRTLFLKWISGEITIDKNIPEPGTTIPPEKNTWNVINPEEKKLIEDLNENYNKTSYKLPPQKTEIPAWYSYNQRTAIIVDYLTKNTLKINKNINKTWYLYIKLKQNPQYPIFIYWHWSEQAGYKRSGDLDLNQAIEKISDTEYVFDMKKIPYKKYYDWTKSYYDWLRDINSGQSLFLALASKWFDGNYVQEVIIFTK